MCRIIDAARHTSACPESPPHSAPGRCPMRSIGTVISLLALAAGAALADVDAETAASLKAKSTLAPEGEVETFRFAATAGTRLAFSLNVARGASLHFTPVLTAPDA